MIDLENIRREAADFWSGRTNSVDPSVIPANIGAVSVRYPVMNPETRAPHHLPHPGTTRGEPALGQKALHGIAVGALRGVGHGRDHAITVLTTGRGQRGHHGDAGRGKMRADLPPRQAPVHVHIGEHERVGVGGTFESDSRPIADQRMHSVGPDYIVRPHCAFGTRRIGDCQYDHVTLVFHRRDLAPTQHIAAGRAQPVQQHGLGDVLRHHERVRMRSRQPVERHRSQ